MLRLHCSKQKLIEYPHPKIYRYSFAHAITLEKENEATRERSASNSGIEADTAGTNDPTMPGTCAREFLKNGPLSRDSKLQLNRTTECGTSLFLEVLFIFLRSSSCNLYAAWRNCSYIIANQPVEFQRKLLMKPWKQASATLCRSAGPDNIFA